MKLANGSMVGGRPELRPLLEHLAAQQNRVLLGDGLAQDVDACRRTGRRARTYRVPPRHRRATSTSRQRSSSSSADLRQLGCVNEWCSWVTIHRAVVLPEPEREPESAVGVGDELVGRSASQQRPRERDVVARRHRELHDVEHGSRRAAIRRTAATCRDTPPARERRPRAAGRRTSRCPARGPPARVSRSPACTAPAQRSTISRISCSSHGLGPLLCCWLITGLRRRIRRELIGRPRRPRRLHARSKAADSLSAMVHGHRPGQVDDRALRTRCRSPSTSRRPGPIPTRC